ncbi:MAG TPA: ATP phosphoribosyltransferase regulatory subunit [Bacillales bacterium]|nr:ATP phosphoribosyltransferase regulatory subunit [Bacillales bacterium]
MSKPFGFEKPLGMRDTLPLLYKTKDRLRRQMEQDINSWGYMYVETPALEYYDTVGTASSIEEQQLFKLLDQEGKTVVLRPDMTAPIARIAVSTLKEEAYPLRLAYDTSVFRAQQREGGRPAEFEQVGVELIGDGSISADAEVISLMVHVLKTAGLRDFKVAVGHVGYVNKLLSEIAGNEERAAQLRRFLFEKNYVGFRKYAEELGLTTNDRSRLTTLLELRGDSRKISEASKLIKGLEGRKMLDDLGRLADLLEDYGVGEHVQIDFTLVSHMDYYTGIVFEGVNGNIGFPLASGGRYDELLGRFGRPAPATGFGVFFDRLVEAIGTKDEKEASCCILYTPDRRKEAMMKASTKRSKGESVVLQELVGVPDVDPFTERFSEVLYFLGKGAER